MVTIYYCKTCQYRPVAEAIAAALKSELGLQCEIREGKWGTFRIERDGQEIYNRWKVRGFLGRIGLGRAPTPQQVVDLFRQSSPASV